MAGGGEISFMPVITDEFRTANYLEAGLWLAISLIAAVMALRKRGRVRSRCLLLAAAMVAFGFSDIVETTTGAWWRPWWLFVWKAVCVAVFVVLLGEHYWLRFRRSRGDAVTP
jgi:hypothetical protein